MNPHRQAFDKLRRPPAKRRRSRRARKKLHLGEFAEFGFAVAFRHADAPSPQALDDFWSSFIVGLIEARGLSYGGGEAGFVTKTGRGSATEHDRSAVAGWLAQRPGVEQVVVGALEDAWYGI